MPALNLSDSQTLALGNSAVKAAYLGSDLCYFDPLSISGLVGWYDSLDLTAMSQNSDGTGTVAVGDQVGYWKDKSATAAHVTQGIAANRPTLTASAVNGLPALVFDGSNDSLASASGYTAQNSLTALTRIMVFATSQASIASRAFPGGSDIAFSFSSALLRSTATDGNGAVAPAVLAPLRVYASVFDGSENQINIFFDNVAQSVTEVGTIPATTGAGSPTLYIGSNVAINNFTNGPIAEYLIYNRALPDAERTLVYEYLRRKWGFA
jgi:hypothetical protein